MEKTEYKEITKKFVKLLNDDPVLASRVELGIWNTNTGEFEIVTEEVIKQLSFVQEDLRDVLTLSDLIANQETLLRMKNVIKDENMVKSIKDTINLLCGKLIKTKLKLGSSEYVDTKGLTE